MSEFLLKMRYKYERGQDGASREVMRLIEMCEHDQAEIANLRRQLAEMTAANDFFMSKAAEVELEFRRR